MFNLMGIHIGGGVVLDLFAGSGALGIEALSRGADHAVFIDRRGDSLATVRDNLSRCRAVDCADIWRCDWREGIARTAEQHSVIAWVFVDPPYEDALWVPVLHALDGCGVQVTGGVVCEHPDVFQLPGSIGRFVMYKHKVYGDIAVTLYRDNDESGDTEGRRV